MAKYCQGEPPAKVLIKFKDGKKEEVNTDSVPVDVSVAKKRGVQPDNDEDSATGNCCDIPYVVKLSYTSCSLRPGTTECQGEPTTEEAEPTIQGKLIGLEVTEFNGVPNAVTATRKGCDGVEQKVNLIGLAGYKLLGFSISTITRADGKPDVCDPPDPDEGKCVITVKNSNGGIIYKKEADCPIKYKVRCGDQCAEGEIRCESNQHPGYCCIDCGELSDSLRR